MFPVYVPEVVPAGTLTVTVQDEGTSLEEGAKLNDAGDDVETQLDVSGFGLVPVTTRDAVKASLFFGLVTVCVNELLVPAAIVRDCVAGA